MANQGWKQEAACRSIKDGGTLTVEESDAIFFLTPGKKANRAKAFCGACPVKRDCLNYALLYNEVGIWGGMTDEERVSLRPMVVDMLENQARNRGMLESRNINDFIPAQRVEAEVLVLVTGPTNQELLEQVAELTEALDLLFPYASDLPDAG